MSSKTTLSLETLERLQSAKPIPMGATSQFFHLVPVVRLLMGRGFSLMEGVRWLVVNGEIAVESYARAYDYIGAQLRKQSRKDKREGKLRQ